MVHIQNSSWNASIIIKSKAMKSLNHEQRLIAALIIKPN